jgi:hypothetical protein
VRASDVQIQCGIRDRVDALTNRRGSEREKAQTRLFGSWGMNWVPSNFANDTAIPGRAVRESVIYVSAGRNRARTGADSLEPDSLRYEITCSEILSQLRCWQAGISTLIWLQCA